MTPEYRKLVIAACANNEHGDCAVKAVSLATGISYEESLRRLTEKGRPPRRGTNTLFTMSVIRDLGFDFVEIDRNIEWRDSVRFRVGEIRTKFNHRIIQNKRLASCKTIRTLERNLPKQGVLLVIVSDGMGSHIFCCRGGEIHDWSQGRCNRIKSIYQIIKNEN